MRKNIFVLLLLMAHPARAQVSSGTIVILNISEDRVTVAADSRGTNRDTGITNDLECKIATLGHKLVFAEVGNARRVSRSISDPVKSWDNMEIAKDTFSSYSALEGDTRVRTISIAWGNAVADDWRLFYKWHPAEVAHLASKTGGLAVGIFIEADKGIIYLKGARIRFDNTLTSIDPISTQFGELGDCWPCGQGNKGKICAVGVHLDVAAKFCSERDDDSKIHARMPLSGTSAFTKLPTRIVGLTIDAYGKSAGDVGGKVDSVTITNGGGIIWNSDKPNCSQDQD